MSDVYAWWREALANPQKIGKELAVIEAEPQCGYYRAKNQDGAFVPVAIWMHEGALVAMRGSSQIDPIAVWTWCCRQPVSYEAYTAARDNGRWADDAPHIEREITKEDNLPTDPAERMQLQLAGELEEATRFLKQAITSQEDADKAAVWSKRVSGLYKEADDAFKAEKAPILKAAKACDEKWRWRDDAKELATRLKRHLDAWLLKLQREEEERQRKAREEAERIRREAEAKARAAEAEAARSSVDAERAKREADEAAARAAQAEREAEARKTAAGRTGAKVSLRTFVSARVTDYDAAHMALKDHPDMRALVEQLANRAVKAGVSLAGVERVEEQRAA
jgi:hypothetical protein